MSLVRMEQVLRPQADFATVNEAQTVATRPIAFFPGGNPLHPDAGKAGFDRRLANALPVPFGAKVYLKIPLLLAGAGLDVTRVPYTWKIMWRDRIAEENPRREHHAIKRQGVPDPNPLFYKPASFTGQSFTNTEPSGGAHAVIDVYPQDVSPNQGLVQRPYFTPPDGSPAEALILQQGVWNKAVVGTQTAFTPSFIVQEFTALGDELLLMVDRVAGDAAAWTFAGYDLQFASLFGGAPATRAGISVYVERAKR